MLPARRRPRCPIGFAAPPKRPRSPQSVGLGRPMRRRSCEAPHRSRPRRPGASGREREVRPRLPGDVSYRFTKVAARANRDCRRPESHCWRISLVHAHEPAARILMPDVRGHASPDSTTPNAPGDEELDHVPGARVAAVALRRSNQCEARRQLFDVRQVHVGACVPCRLKRVCENPGPIGVNSKPVLHLTAILRQQRGKSGLV
jgi:hypothetical protein